MDDERGILADREILLLEDQVMLRKRLAAYLESVGAEVTAVGTLEQARDSLKDWQFDFALIDVELPDGEGFDLLREGSFPETTSVVVMTAEGAVQRAVMAMRLGAADFLAKPFEEEELPLILMRCQRSGVSTRLREHRQKTAEPSGDGLFFGNALSGVRTQLDKILQADQRLGTRLPPVLIAGGTGTGKSTLARWIHRHGPRSGQELVEVNCSTLPDSLAESELFGHERGAFTDARKARIGLFEAAHQGTLFLDEAPSLSPALQAKLLTAIEDGKIRRVGGNKDIAVDVRIIAATNADLKDMVADGKFREDLYHRLNLLALDIPPLGERGADIVDLANHLLGALAKRYRSEVTSVPVAQEPFLLRYPWPGNVRELMHELERQLVWGQGKSLDFSHLSQAQPVARAAVPAIASPSAPPEGSKSANDWLAVHWVFPEEGFVLDDAINRLIALAMQQSHQNVSAAARLLGVKRDYVRYRLKSIGK